MDNITILSRTKSLLEERKQLEEKLNQIDQQIAEVTRNCNHSIVVRIEEETEIRRINVKSEVCLFCQLFNPYPYKRRYMYDKTMEKLNKTVFIEKEEYAFLEQEGRDVFVILEEMFKSVREQFPNETEENIAIKVKEMLKTKQ